MKVKKSIAKSIFRAKVLAVLATTLLVGCSETESEILEEVHLEESLAKDGGEIGIEDKIFRIDGDFVYTYTASSGEDINTFFEEIQQLKSIDDKIFRIDGEFVYSYKVSGKETIATFYKSNQIKAKLIDDKIFRIDEDFVYTYTVGDGESIEVFYDDVVSEIKSDIIGDKIYRIDGEFVYTCR